MNPEWAEELVIELRLLGVDGARIGDVLSEVESHCTESAESAQQAFGGPAEYARSLELPPSSDSVPGALLRSTVPTIVQVLGMLVLVWGFTAWREGGHLEVTIAHLVTVTLFLLAAAALIRFADSVLRHVARRPLLVGLVVVANMAAVSLSFIFLGDVIWRSPALVSVAAGATALVGGLAWELRQRLADPSPDGPVTSPLGAGPHRSRDEPDPRRTLIASVPLGAVSIALATVALLVTTWSLT